MHALEKDTRGKTATSKERTLSRAKTKSRVDERGVSIPALDKAIGEYEEGKTTLYASYDEYKARIDE